MVGDSVRNHQPAEWAALYENIIIFTSKGLTNMQTSDLEDNRAITGSIVPTFFHYFIPSFLGLLAMSSAAIVDGIFIGNFVSSDALAALNLLTPFLTLLIGVVLMLSVGGSVRVGKAIGEKDYAHASANFSKTLIAAVIFSVITVVLSLSFEQVLYRALGATDLLMPLMQEYFRIFAPFLIAQLFTITLYFFVRIDGLPNLAAITLVIGSSTNIGLDYVFIALWDWGLAGAAWATAISQILQILILSYYFFSPKRNLHFSLQQKRWSEIFQAAFNGISEFINETSSGFIAFLLNWLLIISIGEDGVAAITIINYLLWLGLMLFYAIGDANQVLISQNYGARSASRLKAFMLSGAALGTAFSFIFVIALAFYNEALVGLFLGEESQEAMQYAIQYALILWPIFLFNGINVLVSSYLTATHNPAPSAIIATSRGLVLPALLLALFYYLIPQIHFLWALPLAELITFAMAVYFYQLYKPERLLAS